MKKLTLGTKMNLYSSIAILFLFFAFFLLLLSFNSIPPETNKFNYKSTFPVILDTLTTVPHFRIRNSISKADYDILYLGYEKDIIYLKHTDSVYYKNIRYSNTYDKYSTYFDAKIQIGVDPSQEIKEDVGLENNEFDLFFSDVFYNDDKYYKAYPVIIKNHEKNQLLLVTQDTESKFH